MKKILLILALFQSACSSYGFQRSGSTHFHSLGVKKIYIVPFVNDTYKAGVENTVYNALVKRLSAKKTLDIVQSRSEADAILVGRVSLATFVLSGETAASQLNPTRTIPNLVDPNSSLHVTRVATNYVASLGCTFQLLEKADEIIDEKFVEKTGKSLWSDGFSRNKGFAANNQLDVVGTTSALINESEFERTLRDIAERMSFDVHESMITSF